MPVTIRTIQTSTPSVKLEQNDIRDVFAAQEHLTRLGQRLIQTSFDSAAISTRYSCVTEFDLNTPAPQQPLFYDRSTGALLSPSTGARNQHYVQHAPDLFISTARSALEACEDLSPEDITHVITVSCTGFYNPGPDYQIVRELGLKPSTVRHHLGFMGCYAAFPALRAARDFCLADPEAKVLVVSVELCTLHVHSSNDPDTIMGSAIFADGAAAAIVSSGEYPGLVIDDFQTTLTPVGEDAMAWNIGDNGFEMVLGTYVPHIIDENITDALQPLLRGGQRELNASEIPHWGIHPGGRAILDRIQKRLDLSDEQLDPARRVLRDYGNMSSATVLFVLKDIVESASAAQGEKVCAMAFGPGLTVETGLFTLARE
ncbi:type III polyketide synthase [Glutamicibacter sp.]|uniref:type III polyketide synthase n=1 Tax=Glutamicibacter sp. TaxID=1931995 RepID=UPI0028BECA90|nr:type III polyketide synthase [Glutamicibacter sp.]